MLDLWIIFAIIKNMKNKISDLAIIEYLKKGLKPAEIARVLSVDKSGISRRIKRMKKMRLLK